MWLSTFKKKASIIPAEPLVPASDMVSTNKDSEEMTFDMDMSPSPSMSPEARAELIEELQNHLSILRDPALVAEYVDPSLTDKQKQSLIQHTINNHQDKLNKLLTQTV